VNPIALGRRARSAVDGVWKRVLSLGAPPGRGTGGSEFMDGEELDRAFRSQGEFSAQAVATTVLVLGATGRVGTILVRKLSLRGYTVRALVRNVAAAEGCAAQPRGGRRPPATGFALAPAELPRPPQPASVGDADRG
jgi:NmrA-like family